MGADRPDGQKRPWLLMAAGIAAVLLVNAAAAAYVNGSITEKLLAREGQLKQEFLNSVLAAGGGADGLFGAAQRAPSSRPSAPM